MRVCVLLLACLAACGEKAPPAPPPAPAEDGLPVLRAAALGGRRILVDGMMADPAWRAAQPLEVSVAPPAGGESRTVELRAAHDGEHLYLLAVWPDEQVSLNRYWKARSNTEWDRHEGEDGFLVLWAPLEAADRFAREGGAMFVGGDGHEMPRGVRLADAWQWGAQTTSPHGQALDLHLVASRGFKGDAQPEDSGNVVNRHLEHERPAYTPYRLTAGVQRQLLFANAQPLTDEVLARESLDMTGYEISLDLLRPARGSRGDVQAHGRFRGAHWILEMRRRLETGHDDDLVLGDGALFAIGVQDGTEPAGHLVSGPLRLRFR